jgi:hypothetical protein
MFFRRRQVVASSSEPPAWNGWTEAVISRVNDKSHFSLALISLEATSDFDGERYHYSVRAANSEMEAYKKMPGLFYERPTGLAKERYAEREAAISGREVYLSIQCHFDIVAYPLGEIASDGHAGWMTLTSTSTDDPSGPAIQGVLYDAEGDLIETIRKAFMAASSRRTQPEFRILLNEKIALNSENFASQYHKKINIKRIIVWEKWGQI